MCTVTFVPLGADQFILTSNRDENPDRVTHQPGETTIVQSESIVCPKDSKAGGSWIAMSVDGRVACLLNGAFKKHEHRPPYEKSRGLILMDYFSYESAIQFHNKYNFTGIENFTLLMLENGNVFELRWDGEEKFFKFINEKEPHIWSSCTLYDEDAAANKEFKFMDWVEEKPKPSADELAFFHGLKNPDGFLLELPMVKTVSITTVEKTSSFIRMNYNDLLTNAGVEKKLAL